MRTVEKIDKCSLCWGRGWGELIDFDDGIKTEYGRKGCSDCGGSGETHTPHHIKFMKMWGVYSKPAPFKEGSGKVREIYEVTDEKCVRDGCTGCDLCEHGKRLRYMRQEPYAPSGCYLTTACVEFKGLSDDCTQLQTLRRFRDSYIRSRTDGEQILNRYYTLAPEIVTAIQASLAREEHLNDLFIMIEQAVGHINGGRETKAFELYSQSFTQLLAEFKVK